MDTSRPIGIFDSGVGGLTVLHAIRDLLPDEDLVYLGDTARVPYGTKSPASVQRYARHAADHLVNRGIKLLVVACNTASALALDRLQSALAPLPVIGVVEPGAAAAVALSRSHHYLVLATESTTTQQAYTRAIRALDPAAEVEERPCSLFVALAEEGWHHGAVATAAAEAYLSEIRSRPGADQPDTAILGCTHFPLLADTIRAALGGSIPLVDSATTTAAAVRQMLATRQLAAPTRSAAGGEQRIKLIVTDGPARFARIGSAFLGQEFGPDDIELADIHPTDQSQ